MDRAQRQIDRVIAGAVVCGCVVCGESEAFGSNREAGEAGWRALGGDQSQLACPACLRRRAEAHRETRAQRRARLSRERRKVSA